jgi:hypothetical protein
MARYPKHRRAGNDPFEGWDRDPATEQPCDREQVMANATDNQKCPKYVAYVGDDYLDADDSLLGLIAALRGYHDGDVVIWNTASDTLAAIIAHGLITRLEDTPVATNSHTNGHSNGQAAKPIRKRGRPRKVVNG